MDINIKITDGERAHLKVLKTIQTAKKQVHLPAVNKMIENYCKMYGEAIFLRQLLRLRKYQIENKEQILKSGNSIY